MDETMYWEQPNQNYQRTITHLFTGTNIASYPGFLYLRSCHTLAGHLEGAGNSLTGRVSPGSRRAPRAEQSTPQRLGAAIGSSESSQGWPFHQGTCKGLPLS